MDAQREPKGFWDKIRQEDNLQTEVNKHLTPGLPHQLTGSAQGAAGASATDAADIASETVPAVIAADPRSVIK